MEVDHPKVLSTIVDAWMLSRAKRLTFQNSLHGRLYRPVLHTICKNHVIASSYDVSFLYFLWFLDLTLWQGRSSSEI
jgi:hypothetical protein